MIDGCVLDLEDCAIGPEVEVSSRGNVTRRVARNSDAAHERRPVGMQRSAEESGRHERIAVHEVSRGRLIGGFEDDDGRADPVLASACEHQTPIRERLLQISEVATGDGFVLRRPRLRIGGELRTPPGEKHI